jgi:hypothetical protein
VPYVRNSRHEAQRAATLLSRQARFEVGVHGIVAVIGARSFTVRQQPRDNAVSVLACDELIGHLQSLPRSLSDPSLRRIHEVSRHLATWHPRTVAWRDFAS